MLYIKLESDNSLVTTVYQPIYRGDNMNQNAIFLIPLEVENVDIEAAKVYLSYIRADGVADVVILEPLTSLYKEAWYQYVLPINSKLSKYPGEVVCWLQIFYGSASDPTVIKSGEVIINVLESKDIDNYLNDNQVTALYQLQMKMESSMETVHTAIDSKADGLTYDANSKQLQLLSGEETIGNAVTLSEEGDG